MRLFDIFGRKEQLSADSEESFEEFSARLIQEFQQHDYLGKAAFAGDKARAARDSGDLNAAWAFYQEMKEHYLQHALRQSFTRAQTLAIDSSVSQPLADILRLEGKHHDALVHIVYWVACDPRPSKTQQQKLRAYFNRCKFSGVTMSDLESLLLVSRAQPDFTRIRDTIGGWRGAG